MIPIDADQQDALIEALKHFVAKYGSSEFLHAPIVLPTDAFFPDAWRNDLPGMEPIVARLLARVGLGHLKFKLRRVPRLEEASALLIRWTGRDAQGCLTFEVNPPGAPTAQVCAEGVQREVARVWLCEKSGRDRPLPLVANVEGEDLDEDFEIEVDVASVCLGFGALSLNLGVPARYDEQGAARLMAAMPALEGASVAFLVAVMLRARSRLGELESLLPHLNGLPRQALESMQGQLMPGETYRRWLEIPVVGDPPAQPALPPPVTTLAPEKFEADDYTLRKLERRWSMLLLGVALGFCLLAVWWYLAWIPIVLFILIAWKWTYATCWRCGFFLRPEEASCTNCRALIVGTLDGSERTIELQFTEVVRQFDERRALREHEERLNDELLEREAAASLPEEEP